MIATTERRRLLSRREVAWHLGLSVRKVDELIADSVLVPVKLPGVPRRILLDRLDLDALIEAGKSASD